MTDQTTGGQATWFVIGIVLLGVVIVTAVSGHPGLASSGGDRQQLVGVLSSSLRVIEPGVFNGADMTALMGSCSLDLGDMHMTPGQEAVVDVFAMMGSVTIRVPEGWTIETRAIPVMGGIRDDRHSTSATDATTMSASAGAAPRLVLRGVVMMGSILIKS
jgi:hypothetical protein